MRLFISGGGTGGHVYPALAVVEQLENRQIGARSGVQGHDDPVSAPAESSALLWLGSQDGVERALVENARIPFRSVQTGALRGRGPLTALRNLGKMFTGVGQSLQIVEEFRPQVCFVTGGYVCAPVTVACRIKSVPVMIYLPDMTPGMAIRWLSRLAQRVAVSFPEVAPFFGKKAVVTGYPVRAELVRAAENRDAARHKLTQRLGIDWSQTGSDGQELPLLLVFGGSQGARSINRAIWQAAPRLLAACQILHVVGQRDWCLLEEECPDLPEILSQRYYPVAYLHEEMPWALAGADLAISRAGASVLAEFPVARLPSVLVPLPIAGSHQLPNARKLADAGGATIVADKSLADQLEPTVSALLRNENRRLAMSAAAGALARPKAAQNIVNQLAAMV